ncbi:MAG TPA: hypothetical protein ENH59_09620 [Bacteroidetes bacterium]|nr:hypothetical protein [Bacteroidota bacterium]
MMRKFKIYLYLVATVVLLSASIPEASAQIEADFFKAGINDGMLLMEAYIEPFANAFGASFNSAWYNTAKPHKLGGFDVTLSVSAGFVPANALEFDLAGIDFSRLELLNPSGNTMAPTIAGLNEEGPVLQLVQDVPGMPGNQVEMVNFNSPPGTGFGIVPAPMLQAGIGMPMASEIKIRYIPTTPIGEGSVRLIGGGLMKSITDHIAAFRLIPVTVSAFGGYNNLRGIIPISVEPDTDANFENYTFSDFNNQSFILDVSSWNLSVIASVNFPIITGYAGIGYGKTTTIMDLDGYIPLPTLDPDISTTNPVYTDAGVVEDVEEIRIDSYSGLRLNVGGRFKFGVFTIHADYTYADYNVLTAGLGISLR